MSIKLYSSDIQNPSGLQNTVKVTIFIYSVMQSDRNTFYGNASSHNMKFMSSSELIFCGNPCLSVVHDFVVRYNQLFYVAMNTRNK